MNNPVNINTPLILGPVQRSEPLLSRPIPFTYALERFYMDVRDGFRINSRGRLYAPGGHLPFVQLFNWVKKHEDIYGETDLYNISDRWLKHFIRFLYDSPLALNTVSGLVANIHAVINALITDGMPLTRLTQRVCPEIADSVYNPETELETMIQASFNHDALFEARDIFIIQSYVGFRVGTLMKFLKKPELYLFSKTDPHTKTTQWFIRIRTNKTGVFVVIPVKKIVYDILERRKFTFTEVYYERYYNQLLRTMAKEAGIIQPVTYGMTISGRYQEFVEAKYELMSSHTARRNFATNAFLSGIPVDNIIWITGHKTRESFWRYVQADNLANAYLIADHKYFA